MGFHDPKLRELNGIVTVVIGKVDLWILAASLDKVLHRYITQWGL